MMLKLWLISLVIAVIVGMAIEANNNLFQKVKDLLKKK